MCKWLDVYAVLYLYNVMQQKNAQISVKRSNVSKQQDLLDF